MGHDTPATSRSLGRVQPRVQARRPNAIVLRAGGREWCLVVPQVSRPRSIAGGRALLHLASPARRGVLRSISGLMNRRVHGLGKTIP